MYIYTYICVQKLVLSPIHIYTECFSTFRVNYTQKKGVLIFVQILTHLLVGFVEMCFTHLRCALHLVLQNPPKCVFLACLNFNTSLGVFSVKVCFATHHGVFCNTPWRVLWHLFVGFETHLKPCLKTHLHKRCAL